MPKARTPARMTTRVRRAAARSGVDTARAAARAQTKSLRPSARAARPTAEVVTRVFSHTDRPTRRANRVAVCTPPATRRARRTPANHVHRTGWVRTESTRWRECRTAAARDAKRTPARRITSAIHRSRRGTARAVALISSQRAMTGTRGAPMTQPRIPTRSGEGSSWTAGGAVGCGFEELSASGSVVATRACFQFLRQEAQAVEGGWPEAGIKFFSCLKASSPFEFPVGFRRFQLLAGLHRNAALMILLHSTGQLLHGTGSGRDVLIFCGTTGRRAVEKGGGLHERLVGGGHGFLRDRTHVGQSGGFLQPAIGGNELA